jgi:hypothetical protein
MKTITVAFEVPDVGQPVRIYLTDTHGIAVGGWVKIGFDQYQIVNVNSLGITIIKSKTVVPAGTLALFIEDN